MGRVVKVKILPGELRTLLVATFNHYKENRQNLSYKIAELFKKYGECLKEEDLLYIMKAIDEINQGCENTYELSWVSLKNWCHKRTRAIKGFL